MEQQVAVSMRSFEGTAREVFQGVRECGGRSIQIDAMHSDLQNMSASGRRDLKATLARLSLHCSGVDFLTSETVWKQNPDHTLTLFAEAVAIAERLGNVPVGTCLPVESELTSSTLAIGQQAGILVSTHGAHPPEDPLVGWHLPVSFLAKEEQPMKTLVEAGHPPMAIRMCGEIIGDSTLDFEGHQVDLRELRGVLDAMRWNPTPIVDACGEEAAILMEAWHVSGPW